MAMVAGELWRRTYGAQSGAGGLHQAYPSSGCYCTYAAVSVFGTNTDAALAASCNVFADKWA